MTFNEQRLPVKLRRDADVSFHNLSESESQANYSSDSSDETTQDSSEDTSYVDSDSQTEGLANTGGERVVIPRDVRVIKAG